MRAGRTTPMGGVYIEMKHLGPEAVRTQFKGMVDRCNDCGFDLASGRVEVVPTAHYMMGGVEFEPGCTTEIPGLYVAGEDAGGVHGANRLGGNGVANSTVFGGLAGDEMAKALAARQHDWSDPDEAEIDNCVATVLAPFGKPTGDVNSIRERLYTLMWDDVGIIRDANSLARGASSLSSLKEELKNTGIADTGRAFNLSWHDWLNLESQILASEAICEAARGREDSRGAHFRSDFPETGNLMSTHYTSVKMASNGELSVTSKPVDFNIVKPGDSLIDDDAGAPPILAAV